MLVLSFVEACILWSVQWNLSRAIWVWALVGRIVLCSPSKAFHSHSVFLLLDVKLVCCELLRLPSLTLRILTADRLSSHPGEAAILLDTSCYKNQSYLALLWVNMFLTGLLHHWASRCYCSFCKCKKEIDVVICFVLRSNLHTWRHFSRDHQHNSSQENWRFWTCCGNIMRRQRTTPQLLEFSLNCLRKRGKHSEILS